MFNAGEPNGDAVGGADDARGFVAFAHRSAGVNHAREVAAEGGGDFDAADLLSTVRAVGFPDRIAGRKRTVEVPRVLVKVRSADEGRAEGVNFSGSASHSGAIESPFASGRGCPGS